MPNPGLNRKIKKFIDNPDIRTIKFNCNEIKMLNGINVYEKNNLVFFNIYGDYDRFYSVYKLDEIYFYEPHMNDEDRLWYNLHLGVESLNLKKLKGGKIEVVDYKLKNGVLKITSENETIK